MGSKGNILLVLSLAIAYFAGKVYQRIIYAHEIPNRADFVHDANFTMGEIPITYYHAGKITDVLKDWDRGFRLYRLYPGEQFVFDYKTLYGEEIKAKRVFQGTEHCHWESIFCQPCMNYSMEVDVNLEEVFTDRSWYASFAKMSQTTAEKLWGYLDFPFPYTASVEHGFISNLKEPMVTASMHANPISTSMAIQFVGRKTWYFVDSATYLREFDAVPASPILLPRKVPTGQFELFMYTSQPGDVIFFPPSYAHIVATHAGPNVMINYRDMHRTNFLVDPVTWTSAMINMLIRSPLNKNVKRNDMTKQGRFVFRDHINGDMIDKIDKYVCVDGETTSFDKQMMTLLNAEIAKY